MLDCTIRDGGYVNNWRFDLDMAREIYRSCSKAGVDYVELGYHGSEKFFSSEDYGIWRFSPESYVREVCQGIKGAKVSLMVDSGKFDPGDLPSAEESVVELIRVAAHRDGLDHGLAEAQALKDKGYKVSLQLMGYSTYPQEERLGLRKRLEGGPLDIVYVADSYGSIFPDQMQAFLEPGRG